MSSRVIWKIVWGFFRGMGTLGRPWLVWIGLLMLVNGVMPLAFIETLEARVVLAVFLAGAALQMILFALKGFVRLLGAGHVLWVPMVLWLAPRCMANGLDGPFGKWLAAVVVVNSISLLIDATDVVRYVLGDRQPSLTLKEL